MRLARIGKTPPDSVLALGLRRNEYEKNKFL